MSNYIAALSAKRRFTVSLEMYRKEHPTASDQGKTECARSGVCCWRRPPVLSQEDVKRLATNLGVPEQELFKTRLIVDTTPSGNLCVIPARKHQIEEYVGKMLPWEETYSFESPCTFLTEDNSCSVHSYKPKACADFKCWDPTTSKDSSSVKWTEEELKALGWSGFNPDDYD